MSDAASYDAAMGASAYSVVSARIFLVGSSKASERELALNDARGGLTHSPTRSDIRMRYRCAKPLI